MIEVAFLGGAGTVTGSKYLVQSETTRVLVDCGLFQGLKQHRLKNWDAPPVDVGSLAAVVLTHAHLDHSGYLPRLVRTGFAAPVHATPATVALAKILLADSAHLQEEDANRANKYRYSKHDPALALYTVRDAENTYPLLQPTAWDTPFSIGDLRFSFRRAGHILGAASVLVEHAGRSVLFSGDVGRPDDLLMNAPRSFEGADALVVESTYGDRLHPPEDPHAELARIVNRVCGRGGVLMIPAFAVGRTQAILHLLADLRAARTIPMIPTYLNSPMAIDATGIFCDHPGDHRLSPSQCEAMCGAAVYTRDVEESKRLNQRDGPMILIAGSGMATGGRILHHLKAFAPDPKHGILLAGYQAAGTRGASLRDGAETLRIHGQPVPIRCERFVMDGLSGHADWKELVTWLRDARRPTSIFVTHGEPAVADRFRVHLREELGWDALVPAEGSSFQIG